MTTETTTPGILGLGRRIEWSQATIVALLCVGMFATFSLTLDGFLTASNIITLVRNVAILGVLGIGMAMVVIGRGIDLSIVPVMAVSVSLMFVLIASGMPVWAGFLLGLAAAVAMGAINGVLIAYVEIPPLFATLALGMIALGTGEYVVFKSSVVPVPEAASGMADFLTARIAGVPMSVIVFLGMALFVHLVMRKTHKGRYLYALGDNPAAARTGGMPVGPFILFQYGLVGVIAFVAGLLMASAVNEMNTRIVYSTLPYDVILVVVIGGVGLSGGKGGMHNVLVGTLLIGILMNAMTIMNLDSITQKVVQSLILLVAVIVDGLVNPRDEQVAQQGDI